MTRSSFSLCTSENLPKVAIGNFYSQFWVRRLLVVGLLLVCNGLSASAESGSEPPGVKAAVGLEQEADVVQFCRQTMAKFPGKVSTEDLEASCQPVRKLPTCESAENSPIFHFDKQGAGPIAGKRILAMALVHGNEFESGTVARSWMIRLNKISPRNNWRVIPVLNPDGFAKKIRTNGKGVDINRNFPTKDWEANAHAYWKKFTKSDPRRYPGDSAGSELETKCALAQIEDFKPDLVVAIHTPYGVLDFDGPKLKYPNVSDLRWKSLGTFPGSLGRFMWDDRKKPVLTIELKSRLPEGLETLDKLQDLSGDVVLKVSQTGP